jgi:hypothetical protein
MCYSFEGKCDLFKPAEVKEIEFAEYTVRLENWVVQKIQTFEILLREAV